MSLTDIKKELKKLDKDKILDLILDLYKKHKPIRAYLDFYISPNEGGIIEKYHDKIFEAFYPTQGKINIKKAKDALSDFKKLDIGNDTYAELLLFFVETGINFINDYGDLDNGFYKGLCKYYNESLTIYRNEGQLENVKVRAYFAMTNTMDMTWGFHEYLTDVFNEFFPDYYDNEVDSEEISGNE